MRGEDQRTYERIGKCVVNEDGEIVELEKEYYRQGWIFKDEYAFYHEPKKPCYVSVCVSFIFCVSLHICGNYDA